MTAEKFEEYAANAGMATISQEMVNWETRPYYLIDCISVCTPKNSTWAGPNRKFPNKHFMDEAHYSRKLYPLYGKPSLPQEMPAVAVNSSPPR